MDYIQEFDSILAKHKTFKFETVFTKKRLFNAYEKYAANITDKKIFLGFESIDKGMQGLRPSEVMTIVAETNVGKSAFAMNVMYNVTKKSNGLVILFSLEMSEIDIFERYIQMEFDLTTYEVENIFVRNDEINKEKILERIAKHQNIISVVKRISIDELISYVKAIEEIQKKECSLIILDHLGLLKNEKFREPTQRTDDNMSRMRETALHLKIPIMLLSQTSRADTKKNELDLHSGKHSGAIEDSSQVYFTLEKYKEIDVTKYDYNIIQLATNKKIDILKLTPHKKKRGNYESIDLIFNRTNLRMNEYSKPPIVEQEKAF